MIDIHNKLQSIRLTEGLTTSEFKCKCSYDSCRAVIVTFKFIQCYKKFRNLMNKPLTILSGHRCAQHNHDIGGSDKSRHMTGEAIDISIVNLDHLSDEELYHGAKIAGFSFVYIDHDKKFIHLDVR